MSSPSSSSSLSRRAVALRTAPSSISGGLVAGAVALLVLALALAGTGVAATWNVVNPLTDGRLFSCSAFWEEYILLIGGESSLPSGGGTTAPTAANQKMLTVESFDLISKDRWKLHLFAALPVGVSGPAVCASIGGRVTVAALGAQIAGPASSDLLVIRGQGTVQLRATAMLRRIRALIVQYNLSYYIVGGVDARGVPVLAVERFDNEDLVGGDGGGGGGVFDSADSAAAPPAMTSFDPDAAPLSTTVHCSLDRPLCDCRVSALLQHVLLICSNCAHAPFNGAGGGAPKAGFFTEWIMLDLITCDIMALVKFPPRLSNRSFAEVVSVSAATVAQYSTAVLYFENCTVPMIAYWDLYLYQWHVIASDATPTPRAFGAAAVVTSNLMYAGGIAITSANNESLTFGAASTVVETRPVIKAVAMEVLSANRTFVARQGVTVDIDCTHNYTVRISTSARCTGLAPGTTDTRCPAAGVVTMQVPTSPGLYFICASLGSCVGPKTERIPCPTGNWSDFHSCNVLGGCCYCDISLMCFSYRPHYQPNVNESDTPDLFYVLSVPTPIELLAPPAPPPTPSPPPPQSTFVAFITSAPGVVAASLVVLVVVVVVVWATMHVVQHRIDTERAGADGEADLFNAEESQIMATYKPIRRLGKGGFGYVFLVEKRATGELFALKYIPCPEESDRDAALREFDAVRNCPPHPNLVKIHDIRMNWMVDTTVQGGSNDSELRRTGGGGGGGRGSSSPPDENTPLSSGGSGDKKGGGSPKRAPNPNSLQDTLLGMSHRSRYVCIVMSYFEEGDLARYIWEITAARRLSLPEDWIVGVIGRQMCSVLAVMHAQSPPIVHRDLKPENILLANGANVAVVCDFGLAKRTEKTYMETRAGSLQYIAPECWKKHYTAAVDMWAVGCIMYGAATGRVTAETARVMFNDAQDRGFKREIMGELQAVGYSRAFGELVLALLEVSPDVRLSAAACLQRIDAAPQWAARSVPVPKPGRLAD